MVRITSTAVTRIRISGPLPDRLGIARRLAVGRVGSDRRTQSRTGSIVPAATQATNTHGKAAENQRRQEPRRGGRYAFILSYGGIVPTKG